MGNKNEQFINQIVYIDKNTGEFLLEKMICLNEQHEFDRCSCDLEMYQPSITPAISRPEVDAILGWIREDTNPKTPERIGLLYGNAGIGKSVVMHDLLVRLKKEPGTIVLGIKSDQFEFVDAEDLRNKLQMPRALEDVVSVLVGKYHRVVLLIDQIDALSLSLSSNRTPLRTLLRIIHQIKDFQHVRIVISCRPYDLDYDADLTQFKKSRTWELKEFQPAQVTDILHQHHYDKEVSENTLHFLGNPLHLYLFLTLYKTGEESYPLSIENLYKGLWSIYIAGADKKVVDREKLLALLDVMVKKMHLKQELSIHLTQVETEYREEISYLLHHQILTLSSGKQLQFFHQTMFDYVYARRFIETGQNLLSQLQEQHQGLFVRAEVKSIITFLRSSDPSEYKKIIRHMLRDTDGKGDSIYRFHLQALVLSVMAYYESPIPEEASLVRKYIAGDENHLPILMDAIHTVDWFLLIRSVFDENGGWNRIDARFKRKMMGICDRVLPIAPKIILDYLIDLLQNGGEDEIKYVSNLFEYYDMELPIGKLEKVYELITTSRYPLQHCCILQNLASSDPEFVENELISNIHLQLAKNTHEILEKIKLNQDEAAIYEKLEEVHPERIVNFYLRLLRSTILPNLPLCTGHEIKSSIDFLFFQREEKGDFEYDNYIQTLVNTILDQLEEDILQRNTFHDELLMQLANADDEISVFIGLYCYTLNPRHYSEQICQVLTSRQVLANAPSWVVYQATDLIRVSYSSFTENQRKAIIDLILHIKDKDETLLISKDWIKEHLSHNLPLFPIGRRKGILLSLLPPDELKSQYPEAYHQLRELLRKFKPKNLVNTLPYDESYSGGYKSLGAKTAVKMTDDAWKSSMKAYTNQYPDPCTDTPSLQGQLELFQKQVQLHPQEKYSFIVDIITDETILLPYPIYGMKGLLEADHLDLAEDIFRRIVETVGADINTDRRAFNLYDFLFALDGFFKGETYPESVFNFLCRALLDAKDHSTFIEGAGFTICEWGINQPRGNAANKLIRYYSSSHYATQIFDTIELIVDNASVYTRAAILVDYALLIHLDKKRSLELFLKLTSDHHPQLMSMPVHRNNPLIYFIDYAFDTLVPFFEKAVEIIECYKSQVIILWLAWAQTHSETAVSLLDSMCARTETARLSLIDYFISMRENLNAEASTYLCKLMQHAPYSDKISKECDGIFHYLSLVPQEIQREVSQCFVDSEMSKGEISSFYSFLADYALTDPMQALKWLIKVLDKHKPQYYRNQRVIMDALFQSYNGIKKFEDEDNQQQLEAAMNILDSLMEDTENNYLIMKSINKLDTN